MSDPTHDPHEVDSATALRVRKQPQPGDVLDGIYRLDQQLGKGGVGVVYRAFHLHLQRPCAIKFMHPQLVSNPELRTRFRREAQSAFQLGHPHIVAITDFRDDPNAWPYLAMELVLGETLRDRLERGPLEPRHAIHMMVELCDALSAAHRRGVIHRDLKPENLILSTVESPGPGELNTTLKVLDFGLSKLLDGVEITGQGRLLGSPSYMSPEQARGDSHLVDARSDIFAVGALLYECLHGDKMFNAERLEQKRQAILNARLPPLRFAERGLPLVDKIIARACSLKPEDRYQTAAALMDALEEAEKALLGQLPAPQLIPVVIPAFGVLPPLPAPERSSAAASVGGGELIIAPRTPGQPPRSALRFFVIGLSVVALGAVGFAGYTVWHLRSERPIVVTPPADSPPPLPAVAEPVEQPAAPPTAPTAPPPATPPPATGPVVAATPPLLADKPAGPAPRQTGLELRSADAPLLGRGTATLPPRTPYVGKWKRRGPLKPIATGPSPPPVAAKPGASLMEIVQQANDILRRSSGTVKRCYAESSLPPSKVAVDITIQSDGRVSDANVDGAEDGADCVIRTLRGLRFPAASDGDSYSTRFDFVNLRQK